MSELNKVTSNLEFVNNYMNTLDNRVSKNISFLGENTISFGNDNNIIYSKINEVINSYYNAQKKLMEKLSNESKNIVSIANAYNDLDIQLSKEAGNLQ